MASKGSIRGSFPASLGWATRRPRRIYAWYSVRNNAPNRLLTRGGSAQRGLAAGGSGENEQADHGGGGTGDHQDRHRDGGVLTAESGNGCDGSCGDPLDEPEEGGAGAGVFGDLGGGEGSTVGADEALGGHQHEEAHNGEQERGVQVDGAGERGDACGEGGDLAGQDDLAGGDPPGQPCREKRGDGHARGVGGEVDRVG